MTKSVLDIEVLNKKVLVRVDFNLPMKDGKITSTIRVDEAKETINYLVSNGAKVILCSHLGRPEGKKVLKYSLKPVYEYLKEVLSPTKVYFISDSVGEKVKNKVDKLKSGEVLLLENLRFYKEEEENDKKFAKKLASLADIYVNDAFGTAHRKHASTYGVAEYLPSCCGFLIKKELDAFSKIDNPERPFVAILGGAKIADKLQVTQNLLNKVDTLLIGGGMAYTFLKAQGKNIGTSICSAEQIEFCKNVLKEAQEKGVKVVLPIDVVCATDMKETNSIKTINASKIPDNMAGFDIGKKTVKLFFKYIKKAKTVVWNGPLGVYEMKEYAQGTKNVAIALSKNKNCFSIIGGGDVVSAVEEYNLKDKISHVSTGGGASLKLIEGSTLAGVSILGKKVKPEEDKKVVKAKTQKAKQLVVKKSVKTTAKVATKKIETQKPKEVKKAETQKQQKVKNEIKSAIKKTATKTTKEKVNVPAKTTTKVLPKNAPSKSQAKAKVATPKKAEAKKPATKSTKKVEPKTTKVTNKNTTTTKTTAKKSTKNTKNK